MAKKMLFIFNPRSGKGAIKNNLLDIVDIFVKGGYDVTVRPTQKRGDLSEQIAEKGTEFDVITVCGGDGTIHEAAGAMLKLPEDRRPRIGYIPAGSTNDFAANLGIPNDMKTAAKLVSEGSQSPCDLGMFNGKPFVYVAAAGILADVSYDTPQDIKNVLGHSAYVIEVIRRLSEMKTFRVKLKGEGFEREKDCLLFLLLNSSQVGGFNVDNFVRSDISDGVFEAVMIERFANLIEAEQALSAIFSGQQSGPGFEVIRSDRFEIETDEGIRWTLDGEFGGEHSRIKFSVLPKAINIIGA